MRASVRAESPYMSSTTFFRFPRIPVSLALCAGLVAACGDDKGDGDDTTTGVSATPGTLTNMTNPTETDMTMSTLSGDPTGPKLDLPEEDTEALPDCSADGTCNLLDILFVIDNSGSMGEEQTNLAANFPYLISKIRDLRDTKGELVNADVNIMVTTTDFGHPLCSPFEKPDYDPSKGAPITTACTDRLERFNGLDQTTKVPQACTNGCMPGGAAVPTDPYIHFNLAGDNIMGFDGVGDPVADALSCIGPQGIDGCGMEATLETMLQALDPGKPWNMGMKPFLRTGAVLAVVIVTDEEDCAVKDYNYFDPGKVSDPMYNQYWEDLPGMPGVKKDPTSAVCWNSGTNCTDADANGTFESCVSADKGVLQPTERYISYLKEQLINKKMKDVVMLGILGVPPVTQRNMEAPYEPLDGGVFDLVYRDWLPTDILPGDPKDAPTKQYEFGIGPGCSNMDTGQAVPPVRVKEVCESLNVPDDMSTPDINEAELRCCIESICDTDFSNAINCLAGILEGKLLSPG
jgi:hypothetical protein